MVARSSRRLWKSLRGACLQPTLECVPKGELIDTAVSGLCYQELLGRTAGQGQSGRPTGNVHGMGVPGQAILHRAAYLSVAVPGENLSDSEG